MSKGDVVWYLVTPVQKAFFTADLALAPLGVERRGKWSAEGGEKLGMAEAREAELIFGCRRLKPMAALRTRIAGRGWFGIISGGYLLSPVSVIFLFARKVALQE